MRFPIEILSLSGLKSAIDQVLILFLFLYAIYGLGEVAHHLVIACARFRKKWTDRRLLGVAVSGLRAIIAFGPTYISLELIERLAVHSMHLGSG